MIRPNWKKRIVILAIWGLLLGFFSMFNPFGMNFLSIFIPLLMIPTGLLTYFIINEGEPDIEAEIKLDYETRILELDDNLSESVNVIREYEKIFDSQTVDIPCNCNKNTFKGLFSPNTENIVECEKCKSKYLITVEFNTTLLSEPLDEKVVMDQLTNV
jgi:hypothetical protein